MTDTNLNSLNFATSDPKTLSKSRPTAGIILGGLTGVTAVLLSVLSIPFIAPALRKICLPYVPATDQQLFNVLKALKGRKGRCIDLGSGDGRIVISIANEGENFHGTGIELNPILIWYSRCLAWKKGVAGSTSFIRKDMWKFNLSNFDNVVIFGVEEMMPDLQHKLYQELSSNARIFACRFPLPDWKPYATIGEGIDKVWIYQKSEGLQKNSNPS